MGADCQGTITLNELSAGHTCAWDPVLSIQPWLALQRLPGGKVSISVMTLDFVHPARSFWAWNNSVRWGISLSKLLTTPPAHPRCCALILPVIFPALLLQDCQARIENAACPGGSEVWILAQAIMPEHLYREFYLFLSWRMQQALPLQFVCTQGKDGALV